jgi:hypothetical protein
MSCLLPSDSRFTPLTSNHMIPRMFHLNSLIHSFWNVLNIPWESFSSLVISLALVNDIPQLLVIKWFLPCSTSIHLFAWLESYNFRIRTKTLGWAITLLCVFFKMRWRSFEHIKYFSTITMLAILLINILSHVSTLY